MEERSNTGKADRPSSSAPTSRVGVSGFVFEDGNRNGTFDADDVRMPQQTVILADPAGTTQIRLATTGSDGTFRFDDLAAADYRVTVQIPDGFDRTNDSSMVLTLGDTAPSADVRFGVAPRAR